MTKFTTDQKLSAVMAYREGKDSMNHRLLQHTTNQGKIKTESGAIPDPVRSRSLDEITVSNF
ncbi:hypothetical protein EXIGUO8A_80245 [Exiguobacterium sp. 8A]|nr:hypothetical protein EXIGUO8A_80245 [Exiguobacterium sp. 8A]